MKCSALKQQVGQLSKTVDKLGLHLGKEKSMNSELKKEVQALEPAMSRADTNTLQMQKRVQELEGKGKGKRFDSNTTADVIFEISKQQQQTVHQVTQLQQQMEHQERLSRLPNVMVFGITEDSARTPTQQVQAALDATGVPGGTKIVRAFRLGVPSPPLPSQGPSSARVPRPRPIKLMLQTAQDAYDLLRHTRRLRESQRINLDKDLTPQQTHLRQQQQEQARELRNRGIVTFWRAEKLMYKDPATGRPECFNGRMPPRT